MTTSRAKQPNEAIMPAVSTNGNAAPIKPRATVAPLDHDTLPPLRSDPSFWGMATTHALARMEREVSLQAAVIGFTGDFWIFALIALAALLLLLFIGKTKAPRGADRAEAMVIAE